MRLYTLEPSFHGQLQEECVHLPSGGWVQPQRGVTTLEVRGKRFSVESVQRDVVLEDVEGPAWSTHFSIYQALPTMAPGRSLEWVCLYRLMRGLLGATHARPSMEWWDTDADAQGFFATAIAVATMPKRPHQSLWKQVEHEILRQRLCHLRVDQLWSLLQRAHGGRVREVKGSYPQSPAVIRQVHMTLLGDALWNPVRRVVHQGWVVVDGDQGLIKRALHETLSERLERALTRASQ